jgi:hypothetical protein
MLIKITSFMKHAYCGAATHVHGAELCREAIQGKKEALKVRHLQMY